MPRMGQETMSFGGVDYPVVGMVEDKRFGKLH